MVLCVFSWCMKQTFSDFIFWQTENWKLNLTSSINGLGLKWCHIDLGIPVSPHPLSSILSSFALAACNSISKLFIISVLQLAGQRAYPLQQFLQKLPLHSPSGYREIRVVKRLIKASHDAVITGKEYGCWETKGKVYLLCKKDQGILTQSNKYHSGMMALMGRIPS